MTSDLLTGPKNSSAPTLPLRWALSEHQMVAWCQTVSDWQRGSLGWVRWSVIHDEPSTRATPRCWVANPPNDKCSPLLTRSERLWQVWKVERQLLIFVIPMQSCSKLVRPWFACSMLSWLPFDSLTPFLLTGIRGWSSLFKKEQGTFRLQKISCHYTAQFSRHGAYSCLLIRIHMNLLNLHSLYQR